MSNFFKNLFDLMISQFIWALYILPFFLIFFLGTMVIHANFSKKVKVCTAHAKQVLGLNFFFYHLKLADYENKKGAHFKVTFYCRDKINRTYEFFVDDKNTVIFVRKIKNKKV